MSLKTLVHTSVLCVILVLFQLCSKAQLNANFSANVVAGCSPILVQFNDQSTGNPTNWKWDLGNGTISFLQNPSVTYFTPGDYTVKLVVYNANGQDSIEREEYITVYSKPTLDFIGTPLSGCYPLPVQFTDRSIAGSGNLVQWQWDFGDGLSSTLQNPNNVYLSEGHFNVSLRVTNSFGCSNTMTRPQYVQIDNGVDAGFTHNNPTSCTLPISINFQNSSTGTGNLTYQWNFGDGSTSTEENPAHNYTSAGSYTVRLVVTNGVGCTDTLVKPNAVVIGNVRAAFNVPVTICKSMPANFTNISTPAGVTAFWDFGDGTTSTEINPSKIYTTPGTYTVKLVSSSGGCSDSLTRNITVSPQPVASFSAAPVSGCKVPFDVTFTNTSSNALSYLWSFGDGTTSTEANPVHTYLTAGTYNVRLTATNSDGCSHSVTEEQLIAISLPSASITELPQEGCAPFSWTFTSTVESTDPVSGYLWSFGDGTTSTDANPTHIFEQGLYDIQLIITTANGCSDTTIVTQGIKAGNRPQAAFSALPRETCAWQTIVFTDLSVDTADRWLWEFGDGGSSTLQNPEHKYRDTGWFTVKLIVWNMGCTDTLEVENYIHILPPIAKMRMNFDCALPMVRSFTDLSVAADRWTWQFGDGTTSVEQNPTHVYATPGVYTVYLIAHNNITGCSDTTRRQIAVADESPAFTASDTIICKNSPVTFTAGANPLFVSSYSWNFGDGATGTGRQVTHRYTTSGLYTVTMIMRTTDGCIDTLTKTDYILVNGPTANFSPTVPGSCKMSPITFADSSVSDGTNPIVSWTWNYGDGIIETLNAAPFIHTYSTPGTYNVLLTVTDTQGCTDSISKQRALIISNPRAAFSSPDSLTCPGRTINFNSHSSGPGLVHTWHFGDGNTGTGRTPTHEYAADGNYTIKLVVTDIYGCSDSMIKPSYIRIVTPTADFISSDTLGTCPPLVVDFTNTSLNYTSYRWDFGDGTFSSAANPSHFYPNPGIYIAKLIATGPGGCTSEKRQTIIVRGPQGTFTYRETTGCDPLTVSFRATTLDRVSFIWDFNDGNTVSTMDSIISHTYTVPGFYVPKMILIDAGGCVVPIKGLDTIWVKGVEASFEMDAATLCDEGDIQFSNTSTGTEDFVSFHWDFGDGNSSSAENPTHHFTTPGIFYPKLTVQTLSGCRDEFVSPVPVKVVASPDAALTKTSDGCIPLTATFTGLLNIPDTSSVTWRWNFANGNVSDLKNPLPEVYTVAGNYQVILTVTNSSGCVDSVITYIKAFEIPRVNAGEDRLVCRGTGQTLNATGADNYIWSPSTGLSCADCPNPVANPAALQTYVVTGTTVDGCSSKDTITLTVQYPFHMTYSRADTLCEGGSERIEASGAHSYTWSPSEGLSNPNISNPVASPRTTTTYMVIGKDDKNCFADTAYVPITVFPIPTVEAGEDKTINVGQMIDLTPVISSDVNRVTWSPTSGVFRNIYPAITVKPRETTVYRVDVTNRGGCSASDNVTVNVLCNNANVFIPNTFSPNGDGYNDLFYPRGTGLFRIKSAKIFNRWGEVVYEKNDFMPNDQNAGWDGRFRGQVLSPDVYVYIIEIICDNNTTLPLKGNVALIK